MKSVIPETERRHTIGVIVCHALIRCYQAVLSPFFGGYCRFEPSCSEYAREAVELHGVWRGLKLAARRFWRCRPGFKAGDDPVPPPVSGDYAAPGQAGTGAGTCQQLHKPTTKRQNTDYGMVLPHQ
jgi:hypothetical protein